MSDYAGLSSSSNLGGLPVSLSHQRVVERSSELAVRLFCLLSIVHREDRLRILLGVAQFY